MWSHFRSQMPQITEKAPKSYLRETNRLENSRFHDPVTVLSFSWRISRRNDLKVGGKLVFSESQSHTCSKSHGTFTLSDWLPWALNALHFNFLPPSMPRPKPPSLYLHVIFFSCLPRVIFLLPNKLICTLNLLVVRSDL